MLLEKERKSCIKEFFQTFLNKNEFKSIRQTKYTNLSSLEKLKQGLHQKITT